MRDSTPAGFAHLAELPSWSDRGARVRVLTGSLAGRRSPAPTYSPLVGAEVTLAPGASLVLPLEREFEYGVLVAQGAATVAGVEVPRNGMSYLGDGAHRARAARATSGPARTRS